MLTGLDDREDYGEDRWRSIGLMRSTIAVVVYLVVGWRGPNPVYLCQKGIAT